MENNNMLDGMVNKALIGLCDPLRPKAKRKPPSIATMERWVNDGVAKATDGCRVEPDGHCQHGKPSWLLYLGYI